MNSNDSSLPLSWFDLDQTKEFLEDAYREYIQADGDLDELILVKTNPEHKRRQGRITNHAMGALFQEYRQIYNLKIQTAKESISLILEDLLRYPPHHIRHSKEIVEFHKQDGFDKSVFVMTKYPEKLRKNASQKMKDKNSALEKVIETVKGSIEKCGFAPRIVSDKSYHSSGLLWDDIELYLLGCSMGIAIVEDKYKPELNPNVALEWGWMRAMGKKVLFLVEEDFKNFRADWDGLTKREFKWDSPKVDIPKEIKGWLS